VGAALSPWGETFGAGPLDEALAAAAPEGADAAADAVVAQLAQFVGRRRPAGDLTLLAAQREPAPAGAPGVSDWRSGLTE
jgi:hypothetical protein